MNHVYRSIWNEVTRSFVAAAEVVKAGGRKVSSSRVASRAGGEPAASATLQAPAGLKLRPLVLEARLMFDAAAVGTAVQALHPDAPATGEAAMPDVSHAAALADAAGRLAQSPAQAQAASSADERAVAAAAAPVATPLGRTEIVFVENNIADYQSLLNGAGAGAEVHLLDASRDGLAQMAAILAGRSGIDAIHIVSHGDEGVLALGALHLDASNLSAHSDDLAALGRALSAQGDLLLYGCDVAQGADGAAFVAALAQATQADVAASTDRTGAAYKGGDWTLESRIGNLEVSTLSFSGFTGILTPGPVISQLDGDSSAWAGVGNTVVLDAGADLSLSDAALEALNSGSGDWAGATLTVQRTGTTLSSDTFGFNTAGALFTVSGNNLQQGGLTFATYTDTGGVLTITATSTETTASTALMQDVARHISYRNDTPTGNTTLRFTLDDGSASTTADVTLSSDTIYVTNSTDTSTDDLSDGVSLSEAVAIANNQAGTQTLVLGSALGNSTVTLAGDLAVSDSLVIDADAASGMTLAGSKLTVASGTTLGFNNGTGDTLTVSSALASDDATASLSKTGAGTLTLSGTNTGRTGTTSITGGVLSVATDSQFDGSNGTVTLNGGTLEVSSSSSTTFDNAVTLGSNGGTISATAAITAQSINFSGAFTSNAGVTLTKAGAGNLRLTGATNSTTMQGGITVTAGNLFFGTGASDAMLASGTLTLDGGGLITTALTGLNIDNAIVLGAGGGTVTVNGSALSNTLSGNISGSGALTKMSGGTLTLSGTNTYSGGTTVSLGTLTVSGGAALADSGAVSVSGALNLNAAETIGSLSGAGSVTLGSYTLTTGGDGTSTTFTGGLSGTGALLKAGSGTFTLSGSNTYTGATIVSAGTLSLSGGSALGDTNGVTVNSGATLNLASSETIGSLAGAGNMALGANTLTTGGANTSTTFSGSLSGSGALVKTGSGTQSLTGTNSGASFTTTVQGGTLGLQSHDNIGTGSITLDGGTLSVTGNGINDINGGAGTGFDYFSNDITVGSGGGTLYGSNTQWFLTGALTGSGALNNTGPGIVMLNNASSFAGNITVSSGMLGAYGTSTFGSGQITLADNTSLLFGGVTKTITNNIVLGGNALMLTDDATTFNNAPALASNAVITFSGAISQSGGSSSLTFTNSASSNAFALSGINSYTGATTVSGGSTLRLSGGSALSDSSAVSVASGGTLGVDSAETVGSLAGAGNVVLGSNTLTAGGDNSSTSFSGVMSGTGGFAKTGSGTLVLSGTSTYTGGTTISSGTLQLGNGGTTGSIVGDVVDNGLLRFGRTDSVTFDGVISGTGAVTVGGGSNSVLILTAANTYAGLTTVSAGTVQIGNGGTTGSIVGDISLGANKVTFNRADDITYAGTITNTSGTLTKLGAGTLTLTADNTNTINATVSAGTLQLGNGGTTGTLGGTIALASGTGVVFNRSNDLTFSTAISGSGSLTKLGAGTLILTASQTYSGGTTISAGTLQIGNGGSTGTLPSSGDIVNNAALVFNKSSNLTYSRVISGTGSVTKSGSGLLILTGENTYSGGTTISSGTVQIGTGGTIGSIAGNVTNNGTLTFARSNIITFSGVISGTGILTKLGSAGTLKLTGENTYTGGTTLSAGTLQIGDGGTTGSIAGNVAGSASTTLVFNRSDTLTYDGVFSGSATLRQAGSGTLILSGTNTYTGGTQFNAGTLQVSADSNLGNSNGTLTMNGGALASTASFSSSRSVTLAGAGTVSTSTGTTLTLSGVVSGSGALTKAEAGTLVLSGTNTYSGGTVVSAGTLQVDADARLGNASGGLTLSGGTLTSTASFTSNRAVNLTGSGALAADGGTTLTVAGVVSGTGSLTQAGAGTVELTGVNTYAGGTTVAAGTLVLSGGSAVSDSSALTVASGATVSLSADETVGSLAGAGAVSLGSSALSAGGDNSSTTFSGVMSGTGAFTKAGTGTLTLSGSNTYSGITTVLAGTLSAASDSNLGSGTVRVAGTLSLTGDTTVDNALTMGNFGGTIEVASGLAVTLSGAINGGNGSTATVLNKTGAGTLTLSGNNSSTGDTAVAAGTLVIAGDANLGSGAVSLATGSTLQITSASTVDNALTLNGDATLQADAAVTLSGLLSGSGGLTKTGTGTLSLTNTGNEAAMSGGLTVRDGALSVADDLALSSGTITLNGGALTVTAPDATSIDNDIVLGDNGATLNAVGQTVLTGVISGSGNLTANGTSFLAFYGDNTYTGTTTVADGILTVGHSHALGSTAGATTVVSGATLGVVDNLTVAEDLSLGGTGLNGTSGALRLGASTLTGSITLTADTTVTSVGDATLAGAIGGVFNVTKEGAGTLTLSGTNTYSGATTVSVGGLTLSGGAALADSSALSVASGSTVTLASAETVGSLAGAGNVALGSYTLTAGGDNSSTTFSGVMSGTGDLSKSGSGTLTLSGANTYTGATNVSAGTLSLTDHTNLGSGTLTLDGGTLSLTGVGSTFIDGVVNADSTLNKVDVLSNAVVIGASGGTITSNTTQIALGGALTGAGTLTKAGSKTLNFMNANGYTGDIVVATGKLEAYGTSGFGSGAITLANGTTLYVSGSTRSIANNLLLTGNATLALDTASWLMSDGAVITFSGTISESGGARSLTLKTDDAANHNTIVLAGANSYTGSTTINSDTHVAVSAGNNLGTGTALTLGSGATLGLTGSGTLAQNITLAGAATVEVASAAAATLSGVISGSNGLSKTGAGTLTLSGSNTYSGSTTVSGGTLQVATEANLSAGAITLNGGALSVTTANVANLYNDIVLGSAGGGLSSGTGLVAHYGGISGSGPLNLGGSGSIRFYSSNTYTGTTTVSSGTLEVNNNQALGTTDGGTTVADGAALVVWEGLTVGEAVSLSGNGNGYGGNQGALVMYDGSSMAGAITLAGDTNVNNEHQAILSGDISGAHGLTKSGSGTLTLSGTNAHTTTDVAAGTLVIGSDANLGSDAVGLAAGSTLRVTGATTLDNALALTGAATVQADAALTLSGVLSGSGNLSKAGTGTLTLSGTNTHSGAVNVTAGGLTLQGGSSLGDSSAVTVNSGTTLTLGQGNETIGSLAGAGNVVLGYRLTLGGDNTSTTFSGVLSGTGNGITKAGTGSFTLSGANTYTGATTVNAGTLVFSGGNAVADSSAVTVASGATVTLDASETIGSLAGDGNVGLGSHTLTAGGLNTSTSYSGVLSGTGDFNKLGTGTMTLSGTNTYSGATTVRGGTLDIASDANLGAGAVTLNGGTLSVSGSSTIDNAIALGADNGGLSTSTGSAVQLTGVISGTGALTTDGSGTVTLAGNNTYSGTTTVNAGTLAIASDANLGSGNLTLAGGSTLQVTGSTTVDNAVALSGDATVSVDTAAAATLSGVVSGSHGLTKAGAGTLTLSATNTYIGDTTVSAGTLALSGGSALNDTGGVTVASGATLSLAAAETIGTLDGAGNVALGGTLTLYRSANTTVSGAISGTGGLVKNSNGTLTLSGSNTYTGTTAVNGGTVLLIGGNALADTAAVTVASGATLSVRGSETLGSVAGAGTVTLNGGTLTTGGNNSSTTFSGTFNEIDPGALTKAGTGTFTLSGTNTTTGATTVAAGTLVIASDANLGSGNVTLAAGSTLQLTASTTVDNAVALSGDATVSVDTAAAATLAGVVSGSHGLTKTGAGTLTLSASNTYSGDTTVSVGTLALSGGSALDDIGGVNVASGAALSLAAAETIGTLAGAGNVALGGNLTLNRSANTTVSGTISGSGGLVKNANGTLTLSGTNTYSGTTTVTSGTLSVAGDSQLGSGSLALNGGTLAITGATTVDNAISVLAGSTVSNSAAATLSGVISGSAALTKAGAGTLTLAGSNTLSGGFTVGAGTLSVNAMDNLGSGTLSLNDGTSVAFHTGDATLANNVHLSGTGHLISNDALTVSGLVSGDSPQFDGLGMVTLTNTGNTYTGSTGVGSGLSVASSQVLGNSSAIALTDGARLLITGNTSLAQNIQIYSSIFEVADGVSATFSGVVSGGQGLHKEGTGTLTLTGHNTYSGDTVVDGGGTLVAGHAAALGDNSDNTIVTDGSVLSIADNITLDSEWLVIIGIGRGDGALTGGSNSAVSGAITLSGDTQVGVGSSHTFTLSGGIDDGSNGFALTKVGAGVLELLGDNSWTGTTTVAAGELVSNRDGGAIADNSAVTVASGATFTVWQGDTVASLSGAGDVTLNSGTLSLGGDNTSTSFSGAFSGDGSLTKTGTGTLTLSGSSTQTGTTTVAAGGLSVTGGLSSSTVVASGATLAGSGSLGNVSVDNGGTLAPGVAGVNNGVGTLTLNGDLRLADGAVLAMDVRGTTPGSTHDQLLINGAVDLNSGTLSVTLGYTPDYDDQYTLIANDGSDAIVDTFSGQADGSTLSIDGVVFTAHYAAGTGNDLVLSAPVNTTPVISGLDGHSVAWAGAGNSVLLDGSGIVTLSDTESDAATWNGASLSVQRAGSALSADVFGFNEAGFSVSGNALQSAGQTFATFTQSSGVLTVSFTGSGTDATNALVQAVVRGVTYRNDTPAADATVRLTLSDGHTASSADVTVTSDRIDVTNTTDTATIDLSDGVSLSEAVAIAAADTTGTQTLVLSSAFASQSLALSDTLAIGESLTLDADAASNLSLTGAISIASGQTLTLHNGSGDRLTFGSYLSVSGDGGVSKTGAGTVGLYAHNTYAGNTQVYGGTLQLVDQTSLGLGSTVSLNGGTLSFMSNPTLAKAVVLGSGGGTIAGGGAPITISGNISGAGVLTLSAAGDHTGVTLTGTNTHASTVITTGTAFVSSSANLGTGSVTLAGGNLSIGGTGVDVSNAIVLSSDATITNAHGVTLSGALSGTGTFTKAGSGTLSLTGSNTTTGTTTVAAGTLAIAGDANLGGGAVTLAGAATLQITGATTLDNAVTLSGNAALQTDADVTLSGLLSGSSTLTKTGSGTLTLTHTGNEAAMSGGLTLAEGTLSVATDDALSAGTVSLNGGALNVTGATTLDNAIALNAVAVLSNSADVTLSGALSGDAKLYKQGAGTLTLSDTGNAAAATGEIEVRAGALRVARDDQLVGGTLTLNGGTLSLASGATVDNDINLGVNGGTLAMNAADLAVLTGVISGDGTLTKAGAGVAYFVGANTYTGATLVNAGALLIGSASGLGSAAAGTTVADGATLAIVGDISVAETLTLSGAGLQGAVGALLLSQASVTGDITLAADAYIVDTVDDAIVGTLSGAISGGFGLTQVSAGVLTLSGASTYTGATTVAAGTLLVSGSLAGTASVAVASGATLSGTGSIGSVASSGAVTVASGGTLAPGVAGAGTLTLNDGLNLAAGSVYAADVAATTAGVGHDQLDVHGAVQLNGGTLSLNTTGLNAAAGDTYLLINNDGSDAVSGTFAGLAEGATVVMADGRLLQISYLAGDGNDVALQALNAVPTTVGIAPQTAVEDSAYSLTLPAGTFNDLDVSDSLTLSATLANGDALPSWLSFNAGTGVFSGTPANGDVGAITVRVTATDGSSASAHSDFTLTVGNSNDAPTTAGIGNQSATEDSGFSYTVPGGSFSDVDAGDSLTLSATLANGDALPSWLSFNAGTGEFSGTPANGDVGAITVRVTATDGSSASVHSDFMLTVGNTNDAPASVGIGNQSATEDSGFSYTVPGGTFSDVDAGDSLTYSATLANGNALPSWLSFDVDTRTFSGTPANGDVGEISVRVTATDGSNASVHSDFSLSVLNVNDAPTALSIANQAATQGQSFSFTLPADTYADVDTGDVITLSATQVGGQALPAWLVFDADTGRFTGTPANGDVGTLAVQVTGTDGQGAPVSRSFNLVVGNINDAPTTVGIANQQASEDSVFSYALPDYTFVDVDLGDHPLLSATLAGGAALPAWLHFDAGSGSFSGTPTNADVGAVVITVTATDGEHASVSATFTLSVANVNDAPVPALPDGVQITLTDTAATDSYAATAGQLQAADVDSPVLQWALPDGSAVADTVIDGQHYDQQQQGHYGTLWLNSSTGQYLWVPDAAAVNAAAQAQQEVFALRVSDGALSTATQLTVQIAGTDDTAVGSVSLEGNAQVGQALSAAANVSDAEGVSSTALRWQVQDSADQWADVAGATGATLQLSNALAGHAVRVVARVTDAAGGSTDIASAASKPVDPLPVVPTAPPPAPAPVPQAAPVVVVEAPAPAPAAESFVRNTPALGNGLSLGTTPGTFVSPPPAPAPAPAPVPETGSRGDIGSLGGSNSNSNSNSNSPALTAVPELGALSLGRGEPLRYTLPSDTFRSSDANARISVEMRLADGRPLPGWLKFDPSTGTLSGQAPAGLKGALQIQIIARDNQGHRAVSHIELELGEAPSEAPPPQRPEAPVRPTSEVKMPAPKFSARPGLSEQLRAAGPRHGLADRLAVAQRAAHASLPRG